MLKTLTLIFWTRNVGLLITSRSLYCFLSHLLRQFRAEGGLPRLVELLRSGNDDVRRSVAWAVLQCGNDLPTATEICRLG